MSFSSAILELMNKYNKNTTFTMHSEFLGSRIVFLLIMILSWSLLLIMIFSTTINERRAQHFHVYCCNFPAGYWRELVYNFIYWSYII